jgi:alkanesulfonate monooxygenase SsuD/methylene tetrahydromethanopterin reductase-like flavin-dependent oxidoreductase (luciferase family)
MGAARPWSDRQTKALGAAPVKFTFSNLPGLAWHEPVGRIVDLARLCEEVGFDRFGVSDWRFMSECLVTMTACVQATDRLGVQAQVTDPYVRHPSLTACAIATMDDLAPGRVILGLGGGGEQPTFWGETRAHPIAAVRDAVAICRGMWRGEEVSYTGAVLNVQGARMNFRTRPDIPILIAGRGRGMLSLAGEIADVVHMASWFINVTHYRTNLDAVRAGAERAGRKLADLEIDVSIPVCISKDRERARRAARRLAGQAILWMAGVDRYSQLRTDWRPPTEFNVDRDVIEALRTRWDMWSQPDLPAELAALIADDVLDQFTVAGEPGECAERLGRIAAERPEATGIRIQAHPPYGMPSYAGYAETVRGMGEAIARVNRTPVVSRGS